MAGIWRRYVITISYQGFCQFRRSKFKNKKVSSEDDWDVSYRDTDDDYIYLIIIIHWLVGDVVKIWNMPNWCSNVRYVQ